MTTIGPTAADFAARLRQHLGRTTAASSAARPGGAARGGLGSAAASPVEVALADRVAALDPADPRRRERALSLFVESLLLAEFGQGVAADPALATLVDRVTSQMLADPQLAPLVDETVSRLLAARR